MNKNIYKIIYKYKNINRNIQYDIFIFLGNTDKDIIKILDIIKDYKFYDVLIKLDVKNHDILIKYYGEKWYNNFFNYQHIKNTFDEIIKNNMKSFILKNLNEKLYNIYFSNYNNKINIKFGFNEIINNNLYLNQIKNKKINDNDFYDKILLKGGNNDNDEEVINLNDIIDFDNIEDVIEDNKLINDINNIKNKNNIDTKYYYLDEKKYNNNHLDEILNNVFNKIYIYDMMIYNDDNIKNIKRKISSIIKVNKKLFLLPQYLYLWSYYIDNNNKINNIRLGYELILDNKILNNVIEPLDVIYYINENINNENIQYFVDNIKKIRYENNENYILNEYGDYINNNEIFICDIFNELGYNNNYNDENIKKNISNVYCKIYFNQINITLLDNIINYLNNKNKYLITDNNNNNLYNNIQNDIFLENEILKNTENYYILNYNLDEFKKIFENTFITQIVLHINLYQKNKDFNIINNFIELFRIFNFFNVDKDYPFIQYHTENKKILFKTYDKINEIINNETLFNWFESAPYDLTLKIKSNKQGFITINIIKSGRLEIKYQWLENDKATYDDILEIIKLIDKLIEKMNNEVNDYLYVIQRSLNISNDIIINNYTIDFINSIQKFNINNNIDHNELSEFLSLFYPYFLVEIEPRKREAVEKKSKNIIGKYGTYIRYKRISNFDNDHKLEYRILYFLKNYEENDLKLVNEISKQFNITDTIALKKINEIKKKNLNIKKIKILKTFDKVPKFKIPGISISIQGKNVDEYKIIIKGSRSMIQLQKITNIINTLIFLYYNFYIKNDKSVKYIFDHITNINNIAKRKNKVEFIYNTNLDNLNTDDKNTNKIDKNRIKFKPIEGQNHFSRMCQNSGKIKRKPVVYSLENINNLEKLGYKYNSKSGNYERKYKNEILIAPKIGDNVFYACNPENNNDFKYIGFLTKGKNPQGLCMPCCFKKNQLDTDNLQKKNFNQNCFNNNNEDNKNVINEIVGSNIKEKLYLINDIHKIHDNKYYMLPKSLDQIFNVINNLDINIKDHYFQNTKSGYYICFNPKTNDNSFISSIEYLFEIKYDVIISNINKQLNNNYNYFLFLNNGDIKIMFKNISSYINYISTSDNLDYSIIDDLLTLPNIIDNNGVNIYIFDYDESVDDYILLCKNIENIIEYINSNKKNYFLIKKYNQYFPIVFIKNDSSKNNINIDKFMYNNDNNNIVNNIFKYYKFNCYSNLLDFNYNLISKSLFYKFSLLDKIYHIKYQVIDISNKTNFLITHNNYIIPCVNSGIIYNIDIINDISSYLNTFEKTIIYLKKIYDESKNAINILPVGIKYIKNKKDNNIIITKIIININNNLFIPIINETFTIENYKQNIKNIFIKYNIDNIEFIKDDKKDINNIIFNSNIIYDDRNYFINYEKYKYEAYILFKIELSNILRNNKILYDIFYNLHTDNDIKQFLYFLSDKKLYNIYISEYEKTLDLKFKFDFIKIVDEIPNIDNYKVENYKQLCNKNNNTYHCIKDNDKYLLLLTKEILIEFINKITFEIINNEIFIKELLGIDYFYIKNFNNKFDFKYNKNQIIIDNQNINISNILSTLFNKSLPTIGKRHIVNNNNIKDKILLNQIFNYGNFYHQNIYDQFLIIRAFINSLYWVNNETSNINIKNLGYYSDLQNNLINIIIGNIIIWLSKKNNITILYSFLKSNNYEYDILYDLIITINNSTNDYYIIILFILYQIYNIPIILYNINNIPIFLLNNNMYYFKNIDIKNINLSKSINIKFNINTYNQIPTSATCVYYL